MHDPPPEPPSESDCCGTGCVPCVLDVYDEEYSRWKRRQNGGGRGDDRLRRDLLSVTKHKPYVISSVRKLADDVHMYTFAASPPAEGRLPVAYSQHVHVRLDCGITRQYTPVAVDDNKCSFDVFVKSYPGGQFTGRLLKLNVNDTVSVRGPSGGIEDYDGYDSIVMLCGGTGVAAFLGFISSILENDKCDALLRLHYSCKTLGDVLMRKTLTEYAAYWNCRVFLYLTRETDWSQCSKSFWFNENIVRGRIQPNVIEEILNEQQTLRTLWLVCGNDGFNKHYFSLLKNLNINVDRIRVMR